MVTKRKKRRRPPQKVRRAWSAQEWLAKVDWWKFSPANPKRQAYEIIKRLRRCNPRLDVPVKWTQRVERKGL